MPTEYTSIRQKLLRVIIMTSAAALILTCTAYFVYEFITFRETTKSNLSTLGEIIASNSTAALAFQNKEDASEILAALKAEKNIVAACLYDSSGQIFSKYPKDLSDSAFPAHPGNDGYEFDHAGLEGFQAVSQDGNRWGTLYLRRDINAMYARFRLYGLIAFLVTIVSFFIAYLFSRRLQRSVTEPILNLASTAKNISENRDYTVRAVRSSSDEVGMLTKAFNHMLEQIEAQNREIISFNQNLEQKIRERTNELQDANAVLRNQNEFVETIIDSSVDLISVLDKDLNYVILNKHAQQAYSPNGENLIGKNIVVAFPQIQASGILENLKKVLKGEIVHISNYRSPVLNRLFESFYIPLKNKDNNVDRILMVAHDITAIMEVNEQLQELNTELEKSNQSLEQFAYVASHDLQEPLRKIQTFSELAERNIKSEENLKRYLDKINSSASRMSDLIRAILNYSRLSKVDTEFVDVDLNTIIDHIKTDLELLISEKNAVVQHDDLPIIKGSPDQLSQLFMNLISNSLKFSDKQPVITVTSRLVSSVENEASELNRKGKFVELAFSDNGIGFDQQYADKIFHIFQRVHVSSKYAGTGIGLALCKRIVENHHGTITVKSKPGEGTTFYIYFPVPENVTIATSSNMGSMEVVS